MAYGLYGLNTYTRFGGHGLSWPNRAFTSPTVYDNRKSCTIVRQVALNGGDKVRMFARLTKGSAALTSSETIRFRIKKLYD